jgi:hypothetical protein
VSLQGSFETIALPDVMALLASSNKSGELRVVGGQVEGRMWLKDGCLVASSVGKAHGHVDAMFELLCLTEGNFVFKDGVDASAPEEAVPVEPIVHQAQEMLREWREIETVVPSLDHRVRLVPVLPMPEVTVSADDWKLVMAIALAGTVRGVCDELALGHFEGCRGIKHLVDGGLVLVEAPRVRPAGSDPARHPRRSGVANGTGPALEGGVAPAQVTLRPSALAIDLSSIHASTSPIVELRPAADVPSDDARLDEQPHPAAVTVRPLSLRLPPDVQRALNLPLSPDEPVTSNVRPMETHHAAQVVREIMEERPAVFDGLPVDDAPNLAVVRHLFPPKADDTAAPVAQAPVLIVRNEPAPVSPPAVAPAATADDHGADYHLEAWKQSTGVSFEQSQPVLAAPAEAPPAEQAQGHDPEGDSINRGLLLKFLSSVRS